jgi:hypothetical protein
VWRNTDLLLGGVMVMRNVVDKCRRFVRATTCLVEKRLRVIGEMSRVNEKCDPRAPAR